MAFKQTQSRVIIPVVEMTPMIDIVFLLIIFFMVAAQFAEQARVDLNLPNETGEQIEETRAASLIINIRSDGKVLVDNAQGIVTLEVLDEIINRSILSDGKSWEEITIRADKLASTNSLHDVLLLLNKHGLSATRIATENP